VDESEDGEPKLWIIDFGLSGETVGNQSKQASMVTQQILYLAPELYYYMDKEGDSFKDERMALMLPADIYSLGILLYKVGNPSKWRFQ
jgi:hypothetical protein